MKHLSIGMRLTIWYLAIFALGECAFGVAMWLFLRHHLVSIVDESLSDQTEDLRSFLEMQRKNADLAKYREEVTETYSQEHAGEYLAIYTVTGETVYVSDFLKMAELTPTDLATGPNAKGAALVDQTIRGLPLRFLRSNINTHGLTFIVNMAVPTKEIRETLRTFRKYLLAVAPLVLLTSGVGGYWLSRRALAPVDALTRTANIIGEHTLSKRLEKLHTGDELQRLSDTLNAMLDRIEMAFSRIGQFTADASHELRTPISLMRTEAEIALRRPRGMDAYRKALQQILKEAEKTSRLIEDLLTLARMDSDHESLVLRPLELNVFLKKHIAQWRQLPSTQDHEIAFCSLNSNNVWVLADEDALARVLNILLDNAVKYTPTPGKIEVGLEETSQGVVLSVSDNGIGISESERAKIFERFYRVDKARSRAHGGAGLGLSIARWIVEHHGGTISVGSAEQVGSRFFITLPVDSVRTASWHLDSSDPGETANEATPSVE